MVLVDQDTQRLTHLNTNLTYRDDLTDLEAARWDTIYTLLWRRRISAGERKIDIVFLAADFSRARCMRC